MEAILASQAVDTDVLPPNLKYGLDPTGSFVLGRREATVFALGSSYSPSFKHGLLACMIWAHNPCEVYCCLL